MRKNSIKNTRINGEVQKELSTIIRGEIKDPRIHPMTSVMAVEVAPDLKNLQGIYQCAGQQGSKGSYDQGTEQVQKDISADSLHRNLNLRNTPEIRFILDRVD